MADHMDDSAIITRNPSPGVLVADTFRSPFGYSVNRPRGTRDWLLTYTLSGKGIYRIAGRQHVCSAGDIFVLTPGTPHDYRTPEGELWTFMWVHFVPEPSWLALLSLPRIDEGLLHINLTRTDVRRRVFAAFRRLIRNVLHTDEYQDRLGLNALEEILLLLARFDAQFHRNKTDPRIADTLQYISDNMELPHTAQSLADRVSLSSSRLAHLFKEQTGDSLIETLLKIRLRHAGRLLSHTAMSVSEVAYQVGFQDPLYFSKKFHAFMGNSPTQYRKSVTNDRTE